MAPPAPEARAWIARAFTLVEDVVYIGLGVLLAALVMALLVISAIDLATSFASWSVPKNIVSLLDRILVVLLVVELLYTVQVSFRAHALAPEPFLLVGLISAIRRVLLLTAAFGEQHEKGGDVPPMFLIELGVLTVLILSLSIALVLLRRNGGKAVAERA